MEQPITVMDAYRYPRLIADLSSTLGENLDAISFYVADEDDRLALSKVALEAKEVCMHAKKHIDADEGCFTLANEAVDCFSGADVLLDYLIVANGCSVGMNYSGLGGFIEISHTQHPQCSGMAYIGRGAFFSRVGATAAALLDFKMKQAGNL